MKIPLIARMCPFVTIKSFTSLKTIYVFMANAKHKKISFVQNNEGQRSLFKLV